MTGRSACWNGTWAGAFDSPGSAEHPHDARGTMVDVKRSRTRHRERFRATSDRGDAITVQEIVTETDAAPLNRPGDWVAGLSEFRRMDKGTPLRSNDEHTEFTEPVDGIVYRRRLPPIPASPR
jgi:hypothetical protein